MMAAELACGDGCIVLVKLVHGEDIYVNAHDEGHVLKLPNGAASVGYLGKGSVVALIGQRDDVVALGAYGIAHGQETVVIGTWHIDVDVVVPGYEALVAHCPEHRAAASHVSYAVSLEEILGEEERLKQFLFLQVAFDHVWSVE